MNILGHDLRSPLNTVTMAANVLKMDNLAEDKTSELIESILRTAGRMRDLIEDLLDKTKVFDDGELVIEKKNIDLSKLCRQIIKEFVIANPDLKIDFHSQGNCLGMWDEGRLGQVLTNLLSNAVYYGDTSKPIKVDLIEDCGEIVLQVNNQGKVIPEDIKEKIFSPFWRGEDKKSNTGGLGLGLYIVRQIVKSHGGEIFVESNREYGTTFSVKFKDNLVIG